MIMVLHNYVHVLASCDRVNLIQDGVIAFDKPTAETSIEELTELVVERVPAGAAAAAGGMARDRRVAMEQFVVGVDFGTLSARASSSTRATGGARHGRHRVPARRDDGSCRDGEAAAAVGAAGPRGLRRGAAHRRARRGRGRRHRPGGQVVGIATDFTASSPMPVLRRRHAAVPLTASGPPARVREAVEAPRGPAPGRPHQRASPRSAASRGWPATAAASRPSGRSRRRCRCSRRTRSCTRARTAGSRPRTGSSGSCAGARRATPALAGYKAIHQDGAYPSRGLPARARPALRGLRGRQARRPALAARRPRRRPDRRRPRSGPACRPGSRWRWATSTPTSPRPRPAAIDPGQLLMIMGTSTCHVMNGDAARRGARDVRRGARRDRARPVRLRGRPDRRRGHASPGSSSRPCRRATAAASDARPRRARLPVELAAAQEVGAHGLLALDWLNGNRSVLVDHEFSGVIVGLDARHPRRGRLPRAGRGDRVRHARDPRRVRGRRAAGRAS